MKARIRSIALNAIIVTAAAITPNANAQSDNNLELIFSSDNKFAVARIINNSLIDGRYIVAESREFQTNWPNGKSTRISTLINYAFDCKEPTGIAVIHRAFNLQTNSNLEPNWGGGFEEGVSERFNPKDLAYKTLPQYEESLRQWIQTGQKEPIAPNKIPLVEYALAQFACKAALDVKFTKQAANEALANGGLKSLTSLFCMLGTGSEKSHEIKVKFDEAYSYVQMNGKWKVEASVTPDSVQFKDGEYQFRISRNTGRVTATHEEDSTPVATGQCELAQSLPKKF